MKKNKIRRVLALFLTAIIVLTQSGLATIAEENYEQASSSPGDSIEQNAEIEQDTDLAAVEARSLRAVGISAAGNNGADSASPAEDKTDDTAAANAEGETDGAAADAEDKTDGAAADAEDKTDGAAANAEGEIGDTTADDVGIVGSSNADADSEAGGAAEDSEGEAGGTAVDGDDETGDATGDSEGEAGGTASDPDDEAGGTSSDDESEDSGTGTEDADGTSEDGTEESGDTSDDEEGEPEGEESEEDAEAEDELTPVHTVRFEADEHVSIYIQSELLSEDFIQTSEESLTFSVIPDEGWLIAEVLADGEPAVATENENEYLLSDLGEEDTLVKVASEEEPVTYESGVLSYRGADYEVRLSYPAEAEIPADARLEVREIMEGTQEYTRYFNAANRALGNTADEKNATRARFFDITILAPKKTADGQVTEEEVEPKAQVSVEINYDIAIEVASSDKVEVVHFAENNPSVLPDVLNADPQANATGEGTETVESVEFQTSEFSVYGFMYTVIFTYEGYSYTIPGEGSVLLSALAASLNLYETEIGRAFDVRNVESVSFSDESLLSVTRVEGDWLLQSLASFETEEVLTITMDNGSKFFIAVTDPAASSNLLKYFLVDETITAPTDENGNYIVRPGSSYSIKLFFKETPDLQFDNEKMTYGIPEGLKANGHYGTFSVRIQRGGQTYIIAGNQYSIENNILTVIWNQSDPNFEHLTASPNVWISLSFDGTFNGEKSNIEFSDGVNVDLIIDNSSSVTASKAASVDLVNKKVNYTVSVVSSGNSENVHVTDTITDSQNVLSLYSSSISATSSKGGLVSFSSLAVSGNSFDCVIPSMSDGEIVTFRYSANIDTSRIPVVDNNPTVVIGENTVKVSNEYNPTPVERKISTTIDYRPKITKEGMTIDEDGTTFNCRYTFNTDAAYTGANHTITDTLGDYLTLEGTTGATISVYSSTGEFVRSMTLNWGEDNSQNGRLEKSPDNRSFTFTTPAEDSNYNYRYVVDYQVKVVNTGSPTTQTTVTNTVTTDGGASGTGTGVFNPSPGDIKVYKRADDVDYQNMKVTWTASILVPEDGLSEAYATLVDTPRPIYEGALIFRDEFDSDTEVVITGLADGETYDVTENPANHSFSITFYKDPNKTQKGLKAGDVRTVDITFKTKLDEEWVKRAAGSTSPYYYNHYNDVRLNGITASAIAQVAGAGITKTAQLAGYRTVNGTQLPVYKYTLILSDVTKDVNEIQDIFDRELLMPFYVVGEAEVEGFKGEYRAWHTTNIVENVKSNQPVSYVDTDEGMIIRTSYDSMVHDNTTTTGFYPETKLIYYLTVKDAAAYKKIHERALSNGDGIYEIDNQVAWGDFTDNGAIAYEYKGLKKTLLTPKVDLTKTDQEIYTDFELVVNPAGEKLNGGAPLTLTDTVTNLSVDITSIQVTPSEGVSWDMTENTVTYTIPDATKVVIKYRARVIFTSIGEQDETVHVKFNNEARLEGYHDEAGGDAYRKNEGSAGGTVLSINLLKYEAGNMTRKLDGAVFELYTGVFQGQYDGEGHPIVAVGAPVTNNKGEQVRFVSGESGQPRQPGMIHIEGSQADDGWSINGGQYYVLKEIQAPKGYKRPKFNYIFQVSDDGTTDYTKYIYHSGDTMSAKNYAGTDVEVNKTWSDGNENHSNNDYVIVKLQQKIGDNKWSDVIRKIEDEQWKDITISSLTLNNANQWKGMFTDLPITVPPSLPEEEDVQYVDVEYRIVETEAVLNGKELTLIDDPESEQRNVFYSFGIVGGAYVFSVTNKIEETVDIEIDKKWVNADGSKTWPSGMTVDVQLTADDVPVSGKTATLSETKKSHKFEKLPKYGSDGITEIKYAASETGVSYNGTPVSNYDKVFTITVEEAGADGLVVINNQVNTTERHAKKTWAGEEGNTSHRPKSITYTLSAKDIDLSEYGITNAEQTISSEANYKADWEDLPMYTREGKLIEYDVAETAVAYYTKTDKAWDDTTKTWTFTNTLGVAKQSLGGTKSMKNRESMETFDFTLTALNGAPMPAGTTSPLKVQNDTTGNVVFGTIEYTLEDLDKDTGTGKYISSKNFIYTIEEVHTGATAANNYTVDGIRYDPTVYTVTIVVTYDSVTGKLEAAKPVYTKKVGDGAAVSAKSVEFENEKAGSLKITKSVKTDSQTLAVGNLADGDYFFRIFTNEDCTTEAKKLDGSAIGEIKLTILNGVSATTEVTGMEAGTYYVKETRSSRPDIRLDQDPKKVMVEAGVTGTAVKAIASITNIYETTEKDATKAWSNADGTVTAPADASVVFTLLADGNPTGQTVTLDGKEDANGEKPAWKANFKDLPKYKVVNGKSAEIVYTVEETTPWPGYTANADGSTITNKQDVGSLKIRKNVTVEGEKTVGTAADGNYSFVVKNANGKVVATPSITITNGVSKEITVDNLVPGKYKVSENTDVLATGISLTGSKEIEIEVTAGENAEVKTAEFTNNYSTAGDITFSGTKTLENRTLKAGEFTFELYDLNGDKEKLIESVSNEADGSYSFSKIGYAGKDLDTKDGDYVKTTKKYKVVEKTGTDKSVTYDSKPYEITVILTDDEKGKITALADPKENTYDFTNTYKASGEATLEATKAVKGAAWPADAKAVFTVTAAAGVPMPENASVTLTEAGKTDFGKISYTLADAGKTYTYTITEKPEGFGAGWTSNSTVTATVKVGQDLGNGKLADSEVTYTPEDATITNEYFAEGEAKLQATKTIEGAAWPEGAKAVFTVTAAAGVPMPENESVTLTAAGKADFGKISYTLADAGKTYTYTIKETGEGFGAGWSANPKTVTATVTVGADNGNGTLKPSTVRYDPANATITNTYKATGEAALEATKSIEGATWPENAKAVFTVTAADGVPMPENTGVTLTKAGKADFGKISYTQADAGKTYTYTITETGEGFGEGWSANPKTITATVTVGADNGDGTLNPSTVTYDPVDATITNTYEAKGEASLEATKSIEGAAWPEGAKAVFTVTAAAGVPMPENASVTLAAAGKADFGKISYTLADAGKTYTYTITETGEGFGEGWSANPKTITATVTVGADNGDGTLKPSTVTYDPADATITNTYKATGEATLEATKSIEGAAWPEGAKAVFTVTAAAGVPMPENASVTLVAAGKADFGKISYTLDDAGKTYTYTITETGEGFGEGWSANPQTITATVTVGADNGDGTLKPSTVTYDPSDATITNTYEATGEASLEATKAIEGAAWPEGAKAVFTVTAAAGVPIPENASVTLTEAGKADFGKISYTLADAGKTYNYIITETGEGFGTGWSANPQTITATVTVGADNGDGTLKPSTVTYDPVDATITNTYEATGETSLEATKAIEGAAWPEGAKAVFTVTAAAGVPMPENTSVTLTAAGKADFGKISYTLDDAGKTYTYTITERPEGFGAGWTSNSTVTATVKVGQDLGNGKLADSEVTYTPEDATITNEYFAEGEAKLQATKTIEGAAWPEGAKAVFTVTAAAGVPMPENASVTLTAAGNADFGKISYTLDDAGKTYTYTITETGEGFGEGWSANPQTITATVTVGADNGDGTLNPSTVTYDPSDATITNTYVATGEASLEATKTIEGAAWPEGAKAVFTVTADAGVPMPENASVTLMTAGKADFGKISYTLDDAGKTYTYTITETGEGFGTGWSANPQTITATVNVGEDNGDGTLKPSIVTYDPADATITNTYKATGEASLEASKAIEGAAWPEGAKAVFTVTAAAGVPMPENASVTLTAAGNADFGKISYTLDDAGKTYTYTITETGEGFGEGWSANPQTITATVTVGADNGDGTLKPSTVTYDPSDATITNTYVATGEASLEATKTIEGAAWPEGAKAVFTVTADAGVPMPENASVTLMTAGKADFGKISYTLDDAGKTYTYTITETGEGFGTGWSANPQTITATVIVGEDNGDGTLKPSIVTYDPADATITNTYKATGEASLEASKAIEGSEWPEGAKAVFTVTAAEGIPMPENATVALTEAGKADFGKITYTLADAGKTYTYTITETPEDFGAGWLSDTTITATVKVGEDNGDGTLTPSIVTYDPEDAVITNRFEGVSIRILKVDVETGEPLAGAHMQLLDSKDNVIEEWISTTEPHEVAGLKTRETYTLVETQAPRGYNVTVHTTFRLKADGTIDPDTTSTRFTAEGVLLVEDGREDEKASLAVTKHLIADDGDRTIDIAAVDQIFYVQLFYDEHCTIPVSDIRPLEFKNSSAATVVFENLEPGRTYYIQEVTQDGEPMEVGAVNDTPFIVAFENNNHEVKISTNPDGSQTFYFYNEFFRIPDGFYKEAHLTVTKQLLSAAGEPVESDEIFFAGIFNDAELTELSDVVEDPILVLDMSEGPTVSATTNIQMAIGGSYTLYIAEVDGEGIPVSEDPAFAYIVTMDRDAVTLTEENLNASVTITNTEIPEESVTPTPTPTETPVPSETPTPTITPAPTASPTPPVPGARTGDDTNYMQYLILLGLAMTAMIIAAYHRRRKRER